MEFATKCIHEIGAADATGACLGALDAWLVIRGIKTLPLRMEQHQKNALAIATWLQNQPRVKYVLYPGLENHPGYEINKAQTTGFGGIISFAVDSAETARQICRQPRRYRKPDNLSDSPDAYRPYCRRMCRKGDYGLSAALLYRH